MKRVEIPGGAFHFLTVSSEGLEILGEPSGEKTVVNDLTSMASLRDAIDEWVRLNRCPGMLYDGVVRDEVTGGFTARSSMPIPCEKKSGHDRVENEENERFHYGRRYDATHSIVVGHAYWLDNFSEEHRSDVEEKAR